MNFRRAIGTVTFGYQPVAMDISLFSGGKKMGEKSSGEVVCHSCGKKGHIKTECRQPTSGAASSSGSSSQAKGQGRGGLGRGRAQGGRGASLMCYKCGGRGHTKAQCRSRTVNSFEFEDEDSC